jgi:site-specific DNA-methyltransferase (adenine-specific)
MNELNIPELEPSTNPAIDYSTCYAQPLIRLCHGDNTDVMRDLEDESVDVILTDPPYKYLKNQKLEVDFDETIFFNEVKRVLKKDGFIILFGRGTSFYRWNTMLADLGFNFKEEIVWDKSHCTSPLMNLSRVHETISIFTKGKGTINKVKVPYLEMKSHDLDSVIGDVKRVKSILKNTKSLDAVLAFLENNIVPTDKENTLSTSVSSIIKTQDRCASVMSGIKNGMNEKSIIRTDYFEPNNPGKGITAKPLQPIGDRCVNVAQSICFGLNEKSIIKQVRDHYSAIHPTQKPVRLLERLLALVIPKDKESKDITVLDPFGGSFSTMEAVYNMQMKGISCEIDEEYFEAGKERIEKLQPRQTELFD